MGEVSTIGVDIAKSVFQIHGVDADGTVIVRKRVGRAKVLEFFAKLPPCLESQKNPLTRGRRPHMTQIESKIYRSIRRHTLCFDDRNGGWALQKVEQLLCRCGFLCRGAHSASEIYRRLDFRRERAHDLCAGDVQDIRNDYNANLSL